MRERETERDSRDSERETERDRRDSEKQKETERQNETESALFASPIILQVLKRKGERDTVREKQRETERNRETE